MLTRREFIQLLGSAALCGHTPLTTANSQSLYSFRPFGNTRLLHFTDSHAQLMPIYYREPDVNIGLAEAMNRPPHLVAQAMLDHFQICLLYTSPSPRDLSTSRMPSSA